MSSGFWILLAAMVLGTIIVVKFLDAAQTYAQINKDFQLNEKPERKSKEVEDAEEDISDG